MDKNGDVTTSVRTQEMAEVKPKRTLFTEEAMEYQEGQYRTKSDATGACLGAFLVGLLLIGIGYFVGVLLLGGYWLFALGIPIGALFVLGSVIVFVVTAMRPTKTVWCPYCRAKHRIFKSVSKYICPKCFQLLRLGTSRTCQPANISCPYCHHTAYVTEDHGLFPCSNCGLLCTPAGQRQSEGDSNCPTCDKEVPKEVLYCCSCESILRTDCLTSLWEDPDLVHDEDWIAGKNSIGHFYFARALLEQIRTETHCSPSQRHKESPIKQMYRALLSLGEVAANPETRRRCLEILPDLDHVYADLLRWELDVAETTLLSETDTPITPFIKEVIEVYASEIDKDEPHIRARRQLETLLGETFESSGSIGRWNEHLLEWTSKDTKVFMSTMTDQVDVLTGCKGLREEMVRFEDWLKSIGSDVPAAWRDNER